MSYSCICSQGFIEESTLVKCVFLKKKLDKKKHEPVMHNHMMNECTED